MALQRLLAHADASETTKGRNRSVESTGCGGPESARAWDETAPWRWRPGTGSWAFITSDVPEGHVGLLARAARKYALVFTVTHRAATVTVTERLRPRGD